MLQAALTPNGWEALAVHTPQEAMDFIHNNLVDLVICDFRMPGMDGVTLFTEARATLQWRDIPFLFLSGYAEPKDRVHALRQGAEDFLMKPVHLEELIVRIQHALERRRARQQLVLMNQTVLQGALEVFRLEGVLALLEQSRSSGTVQINSPTRLPGFIFVEDGRIRGAQFSSLTGLAALMQLLESNTGRFEFFPGRPLKSSYNVSITVEELMGEYTDRTTPEREMPRRDRRPQSLRKVRYKY